MGEGEDDRVKLGKVKRGGGGGDGGGGGHRGGHPRFASSSSSSSSPSSPSLPEPGNAGTEDGGEDGGDGGEGGEEEDLHGDIYIDGGELRDDEIAAKTRRRVEKAILELDDELSVLVSPWLGAGSEVNLTNADKVRIEEQARRQAVQTMRTVGAGADTARTSGPPWSKGRVGTSRSSVIPTWWGPGGVSNFTVRG